MAAILIAEDDAAVREFVTRALLGDKHDVTAVTDGTQALDALAVTDFDLLLADIVMPEMDGIALALKVSKDHPGVRVLLMTGYAEERRRAHNLSALIHDVVQKPFTLKEICAATARVLSDRPGAAP